MYNLLERLTTRQLLFCAVYGVTLSTSVLAAGALARPLSWSACSGEPDSVFRSNAIGSSAHWLAVVLRKTSQVDCEITSRVLLRRGRLGHPPCLVLGCVDLVQRDFLTLKCSILALKPCGQATGPGLRTIFRKQEMERKPFPNVSWQATKQKARWAGWKRHGKQCPKEMPRRPFLTDASVETRPPASLPEQLPLWLSCCQ